MAEIETLRFGTLDVSEADRMEFARGLLGFESLRSFVHLQIEEEAPFGWLQSLEDSDIAFVVANPAAFFPRYAIEIDPRELGDVRPSPNERLEILGICTIPDTFSEASMNLLGPLVMNMATRKGKQLVLNRSGYSTRHRLTDVISGSTQQNKALRPRSLRTPA